MWGPWIDTAVTVGTIIGAIVLIVWLFKKEVKGVGVPGPLKSGLHYLGGKLWGGTKGAGGRIKDAHPLQRAYKALDRAGGSMKKIK
jgi:hypothetical protein